jgi:SH3 domain-containing YSC84-like protein 1
MTKARLAGLITLLVGCSNPSSSTTTTTAANPPSSRDRENAVKELSSATRALGEMNVRSLVPSEALARTQCAVVVPSLGSGAFIVGASHGSGVATCRTPTAWSAPIFVKLTGVSAGAQVGGQSSDVLMLVTSARGQSKLFTSGGFKLGGDMSVAAGPVGAGKSRAGDMSANADIVTYARTKGLFAGVQLDGMSLDRDNDAIAALYGRNADPAQILSGSVQPPADALQFLDQVKATFGAPARLAQQ